jgi:chromosome segregation ATPase
MEQHLVNESTKKEWQLKVELLQREKATLMDELEKLRAQQTQLQKVHDEHAKQMTLARKEAEVTHRREMREMQEEYHAKLKHAEAERFKLDDLAEQYRTKSVEWDGRMKSMEKQIRVEENTKRQEILAKMQALAQHRESLQQSLNAHLQTHRQTVVDYENRLTRERESHQTFHGKIADLTHERDELKSELARLRDRGARWDEIEREYKARQERFEDENTRLKADQARLQRSFDRLRDEEVQRAKELEKAVTGYVRSVERTIPAQ